MKATHEEQVALAQMQECSNLMRRISFQAHNDPIHAVLEQLVAEKKSAQLERTHIEQQMSEQSAHNHSVQESVDSLQAKVQSIDNALAGVGVTPRAVTQHLHDKEQTLLRLADYEEQLLQGLETLETFQKQLQQCEDHIAEIDDKLLQAKQQREAILTQLKQQLQSAKQELQHHASLLRANTPLLEMFKTFSAHNGGFAVAVQRDGKISGLQSELTVIERNMLDKTPADEVVVFEERSCLVVRL